jgi:hypothetical protein
MRDRQVRETFRMYCRNRFAFLPFTLSEDPAKTENNRDICKVNGEAKSVKLFFEARKNFLEKSRKLLEIQRVGGEVSYG